MPLTGEPGFSPGGKSADHGRMIFIVPMFIDEEQPKTSREMFLDDW